MQGYFRGPKTVLFFLWISLLLSFAKTYGQSDQDGLHFLNPERKSMTMPFRLINNLVIIPVFINDSDSLFFILDTGINTTIMTELSSEESLSLNYIKQIKLQGLGRGDPIDALHSTGNRYDIYDIVGDNQDLYIILQNIFNLSALLGTRIHGLLSFNEFHNFIVEIRYDKRTITFYNPEKYRYRARARSTVLPISIENLKPYLSAMVVLEDGTRVPVKLMIDMGASHALWLELTSDERLKLPEKTISTFLGTGLSGQIHGHIGRIASLELGDHEFRDALTAFPDSLSAYMAFGLDDRNGSIGSEILRRFSLVIDYTRNQVILTPNRHYKEAFNINMSGLEVEALYPGMPVYTISHVRKNSPGGRAGLRRGDQILSINSQDVVNLNISDIYEIFESRPGRQIKIVVKRSGYRLKTFFFLEDWI